MMQRVIQRAKAAERAANRARNKKLDHKRKGEAWERNQRRVRLVKENTAALRQDRKNRREDWERGALAPRRDVGDVEITYGAIAAHSMHLPERDPEARPKWAPIRAGDRVVVLSGRDRGKIGQVKEADYERAAVQVAGMNTVDVYPQEWMKQQYNDQAPLHRVERFIHLEDVRLVFPLPHPHTGEPRDVVIDKLVQTPTGDRAIAGTTTIIPYPPSEPEAAPTDFDDDTLRISVEERTFRPFLIRPPMPLSVIDELRGRYSKFRTHHHYDYIQKKLAQDATREARKHLIDTMRTPLQQLAELREQQNRERERELSPPQLALIGQVVAAERAKRDGSHAATA